MPDARQKTSKLADMLASASIFKACDGIAVDVVCPFMALLSFRGIDTPSLPAQGEQRRLSLFNIRRGNPFSGDDDRREAGCSGRLADLSDSESFSRKRSTFLERVAGCSLRDTCRRGSREFLKRGNAVKSTP